MHNNDPYDMSLEWMPQQKQVSKGEGSVGYAPAGMYSEWEGGPGSEKVRPARHTPKRMSKEQALERVSALKQYILVGSFLSFGALSVLIGSQLVSVATTTKNSQTPATNTTQDNSGQSQDATSSGSGQNTTPSHSGRFFQHQGGGYGFGSGGSSSSPVTHSGNS